jgi:hypothetical protein
MFRYVIILLKINIDKKQGSRLTMKTYYAWLNDKPVKKFQMGDNGSSQTVVNNFIDYAKSKLKGKLELVEDETVLTKHYITNGIDKLVLAKETGMEWVYKEDLSKLTREIKKRENVKFEDTELGRYINNFIESENL